MEIIRKRLRKCQSTPKDKVLQDRASGLPEEMRMKSERYRLGLWTDVSEDVSSNVSLAADQDIALRLSVSLKYPGGG